MLTQARQGYREEMEHMKETKENVEDAEMAEIVSEQENRKSQWINAKEVQKCNMEMMEVTIYAKAQKKVEAYASDPGKPVTSLEVPVIDPEGEKRIVTLSGWNIVRVARGEDKYVGLGSHREAWIGHKLRLKAVSSKKAKSGYSLQVYPLKQEKKTGEKSPASKDEIGGFLD